MPVIALEPDYQGEVKDRVENFHGNWLLYIGWDRHLMFCSPICIPVPPGLPFAELQPILSQLYGAHPDMARLDWAQARWLLDGRTFTPDAAAALQEQGFHHKAVLRLVTPGLEGIGGSAS